MGVVAVGHVGFGEPLRAARAFGDVLAGHLEMDPATFAPSARTMAKKARTSA